MSLIKYDKFNTLNDSKTEWRVRVRAQSIWKGITRSSAEFRGYNIVLFDDSVGIVLCVTLYCRASVFILSSPNYENELNEGDIFTVENFKVNVYMETRQDEP